MKTYAFRKACLTGLMVLFAVTVFSSQAFSWGFATHTYIDDQISRTTGMKNANEMYGGIAPDLFNYAFDLSYQPALFYTTHYNFTEPWIRSENETERSLAYGFASHNELWGADRTAHVSGITYGQDEGYVIAKAWQLKTLMEQQVPAYQALGLPDAAAIPIFHELVEYGVDLLVKRGDPMIGQRIMTASKHRNPQFPYLLAEAYADDVSSFAGISTEQAASFIIAGENAFRNKMMLYGQTLMQDEAVAIQRIAMQTADLAAIFLAIYGITLPDGVEVVPLMMFAIGNSMVLCADDFAGEIGATAVQVKQSLSDHGIVY